MVKMLDPMMQACDVLTRCFVNGNKLICSGAGAAGLTAEYMTTILTGGMEIPRPALPALSLTDSQRRAGNRPATLGGPVASADVEGGDWSRTSIGAGSATWCDAGLRQLVFVDFLGAARRRQNHHCAALGG